MLAKRYDNFLLYVLVRFGIIGAIANCKTNSLKLLCAALQFPYIVLIRRISLQKDSIFESVT